MLDVIERRREILNAGILRFGGQPNTCGVSPAVCVYATGSLTVICVPLSTLTTLVICGAARVVDATNQGLHQSRYPVPSPRPALPMVPSFPLRKTHDWVELIEDDRLTER